jgi:hypothetical protein
MSKVFEAIFSKHILDFLLDKNMLSPRQFGFLPSRSALHLLLTQHQCWVDALNRGSEVRAVSLDISRAFDTVWHPLLMKKLSLYGLCTNLCLVLSSFLTGRRFHVVVDGCSSRSRTHPVTAGVPQGSVLGPLLFLIFINDICDDIENELFMFADDTSLYRIVPTPADRAECADSLNSDMAKIGNWSKFNNVSFNTGKTQSITFSLKQNQSHPPHPSLIFQDLTLTDRDSLTLLGISLTPKLTIMGTTTVIPSI